MLTNWQIATELSVFLFQLSEELSPIDSDGVTSFKSSSVKLSHMSYWLLIRTFSTRIKHLMKNKVCQSHYATAVISVSHV